ncbi:hypothetical protein G7046_g1071 [Stylonectria norvegica]|nr:hypothetical protein G7046_g1071 [Stylonectria norvegica]
MWPRLLTVPARYLLPFLSVTLFVIQLGLSLGDLPSIKLMQDIICKLHYNVTSDPFLPEEECRIDPVQRELNLVTIGILVSVTISSALVAFPFGILADRAGRIPILGISIIGMLLSQAYAMYICWHWKVVPIRAIWGLGAPLLLGGGRSVAEAMIFTIISDIVPDTKRSIWFQWIVGTVLCAQLLGPVIASSMTPSSVWSPLFLSLGLIFVGGSLLVCFVPETLPPRQDKRPASPESERSTGTKCTWQTLKVLVSLPAILLLPGAVLTIPLASIQSDLLLRLMPIQFNWPLARSILLISLRSLATLITLFFVLPGISNLYYRHSTAPPRRCDAVLARGSAVLFMFGSLCLMMVTNQVLIIMGLVISALGSGLPTLCRAMLVGLLNEQGTGSMFGILAVGEILGFLACELGMGSLFGVGLKSWMGLPFCLGMIIAFGIGAATWCVPMQHGQDDDDVPEIGH